MPGQFLNSSPRRNENNQQTFFGTRFTRVGPSYGNMMFTKCVSNDEQVCESEEKGGREIYSFLVKSCRVTLTKAVPLLPFCNFSNSHRTIFTPNKILCFNSTSYPLTLSVLQRVMDKKEGEKTRLGENVYKEKAEIQPPNIFKLWIMEEKKKEGNKSRKNLGSLPDWHVIN